jgi:hypothetical protein
MNSLAKHFTRGLIVSAWLAAPGIPVAHAQMLGDSGLRSALTSSLLQTTQQRHRRRVSNDPYMALIAQSEPDRRLRELTSNADPLSPTAQTSPSRIMLASQMALAGGVGALGSAMSMQSQPGMRKAGGAALLPSMVPGMGAVSLSAASMLNVTRAACSMSVPGMAVMLPASGPCR